MHARDGVNISVTGTDVTGEPAGLHKPDTSVPRRPPTLAGSMTTGPSESGDGRGEAAAAGHVPADDGAPTEALVSGAVGDRCVNCGAPLSSDQRYCVSCGERRGQPRFSLPATATAEQGDGPARAAGRARPSRGRDRLPRASSGATLVAGVGTLLLAMGVGVLIGHETSNSPKQVAAAPAQVIKVGGGSGTTGGASSSSRSSGGSSRTRHKSTRGRHTSTRSHHRSPETKAAASAPPPPAVVHKASQAAAKVLGGSAKNVPPPTVTAGQKGTGAGFNKKTHKFDGSFFGQ